MSTNLMLDVAEVALTRLPINSSVCFVNIDDIHKDILAGKGMCKIKATESDIRNALKTIFPIYKNKRKNIKLFKISSNVAYKSLRKLDIKLRPLLHIIKK
ncbi:hypothetical protein ACH518_19990 [Methylomonas sp. HW2-6]|uniref:hypothetical protein n=1 Tax=Methylomonas sp. HW2-6 TaxID=3376687 RepID=UPI0040428C26